MVVSALVTLVSAAQLSLTRLQEDLAEHGQVHNNKKAPQHLAIQLLHPFPNQQALTLRKLDPGSEDYRTYLARPMLMRVLGTILMARNFLLGQDLYIIFC